MILEQCKGVHCLDLGESFQAHNYLQNVASIQPRTSRVKFACSPCTDSSSSSSYRSPRCEPYLIWSATKITTAAAIGAAVAEGYLGWDDRVHQHIDWWTSDEADGRSHVTLKHLLSLSSGFGARSRRAAGLRPSGAAS